MLAVRRQARWFASPIAKKMCARAFASQTQTAFQRRKYQTNSKKQGSEAIWLGAVAVSATMGTAMAMMESPMKKNEQNRYLQLTTLYPNSTTPTPTSIPKADRVNQPAPRPDLPVFTREEVAEHCDEDSLWYTFRGAVYDLTKFYQGHPGGAPVSSWICCILSLPPSLQLGDIAKI